tara:strand:- start:6278 stop:6691 length:414 start_codon:yes stop_codon:yes gene_type:complete
LEKQIIKILSISKTIALVGASANEKKPSFVVMSYLQSYGYKVLPINPFHSGKKILGEYVLSKLNDIEEKIDLVDVFRPSEEAPDIAKQSVDIGANALWLQLGISNQKARNIAKSADINFIQNKCIKIEHQRLFNKEF